MIFDTNYVAVLVMGVIIAQSKGKEIPIKAFGVVSVIDVSMFKIVGAEELVP